MAVVTDFRVGWAVNDQVLLYYQNIATFGSDMFGRDKDLLALSGFGTTYMFSPTSPSAFVNGAVGVAVAGDFNFDSGSTDSDSGSGFSIGGGWEFSRHLSVEGGIMFLRETGFYDYRVYRVTFNYLFY